MNEKRLGESIRAVLDDAERLTPNDVSKRLATARKRAVLAQRPPARIAQWLTASGNASASALALGGYLPYRLRANLWQVGVGIALLSAALAFGAYWKEARDINKSTETNLAFMLGELPPEAFVDKGFDGWIVYTSL